MTRKMLSKIFSFRKHCRSVFSVESGDTSPEQSFSSRLMDENISFAESIINKWDLDSFDFAKLTSLFYDGRADASLFLRAIADLRRAMIFFSSPDCPHPAHSRAQCLIRSQTLMQSAMRRLEQEFYRILSTNFHRLDPASFSSSSSSDDEEIRHNSYEAIADLRSIAESMMANGYGMECVRIYKLLRKSILEESLFGIGFDLRLPCSNFHKIDWQVLDLRIQSWLDAARISFSNLFAAERLLCNYIFDMSDSINLDLIESCFADVTKAASIQFLSFPESIAKTKPSPGKLFRILELHQSLSNLFPQIESTFSYESTTPVKSKALEVLKLLADAARDSLSKFELAIQKESSIVPVPGARVHRLTRNAMNYLSGLSDYLPTLVNIYAGVPFYPPQPLPAMSEPCPSSITPAEVSERLAWLLLLVLCKLDLKAESYNDVSLSYLFLANNIQYVVNKVKTSGLEIVLGVRWVEKHEEIAKRYLDNFVRLVWGKTVSAMLSPENGDISSILLAIEEAAASQEGVVVEDDRMREEVRSDLDGKIVPAYRRLYESFVNVNGEVTAEIWYSPDGLRDRIKRAFVEPDGSAAAGLENEPIRTRS